jgi:hypothetical protein
MFFLKGRATKMKALTNQYSKLGLTISPISCHRSKIDHFQVYALKIII